MIYKPMNEEGILIITNYDLDKIACITLEDVLINKSAQELIDLT